MIHLETISDTMQNIGEVLYEKLSTHYYLAGGTALALHTGHRTSVDLDFFTDEPINTEDLKNLLNVLFHDDVAITYEDVNTLWCLIEGVKVSFITRQTPHIEKPIESDGFRIAQPRDILVMKLSAVCGREEYKDYYDIAVLLSVIDGNEWISLWQKAYPKSDPISWIVALSYVSHVAEIPLQGENIIPKREVETTLLTFVKELSSFSRI